MACSICACCPISFPGGGAIPGKLERRPGNPAGPEGVAPAPNPDGLFVIDAARIGASRGFDPIICCI